MNTINSDPRNSKNLKHKKTMQRHIIIKLLDTNDKEKLLRQKKEMYQL